MTSTEAGVVRPIPYLGPLHPIGLAVALVFIWRSFLPTLMPRGSMTQAAMTALAGAIGYALGMLLRYIIRQFTHSHPVPATVRRIVVVAVAAGGVLVVGIALIAWPRWQNQQRELIGMEPIGVAAAPIMVIVALVLMAVLGLLGRLIARGVVRVHRFNLRHLPAALASPATILLVIVVGWLILDDVVIKTFTEQVNRAYGTVDTGTSPGTTEPSSPFVSGGPGSPISWDSLGLQGRDFVGRPTPTDLLAEFDRLGGGDGEVLDPIRVYAGLRSADTPETRAAAVLGELIRTGAFEREVLVVATVTGTGWVDPYAARTIELMYGGDTAIAAIQYSYLPSWISSLVDGDKMKAAGTALYNTVYEYWRELPVDDRPTLVAFGQSLGSLGAEAAFVGNDTGTSILNLRTRADAVLFTGPTNANPMWNQFEDDRDPGSPVWRPVVDGGRTVRFSDGTGLDEMPTAWDGPRVLYVQHPSDPVTYWGMSWLYRTPAWMHQPRGGDVPAAGGWFPIVTWIQGVFDLMAGFSAPPGHGHDYSPNFPGAWSQVVPPAGWTAADIERLAVFLDENPPPPSS